MTWTFSLKKNVKWHDGQTLTTEDVAFSVSSYVNPKLKENFQGLYCTIQGKKEYNEGEAEKISGIEVIDFYTISFTAVAPNVAFLLVMEQTMIMPKHIWEKVEEKQDAWIRFANTAEGLIGSGPHKFVQYVTDECIEFERFDDYFQGQSEIKKILIQFANIDTGIAMLESGEVDIV